MTIEVRLGTVQDLAAMATVAAGEQHLPERHCPYLGFEVATILADLHDLPEGSAWSVAEDDGRVIGWLAGEVDTDMGRAWWWGPFVRHETWSHTSDRLYARARDSLAGALGAEPEQEACGDARSTVIADWAERHGFRADPASVLLRRPPDPVPAQARVRPMVDGDHEAVAAAHAVAFPNTHTTPEALVAADAPRRVVEVAGRVVGYVAFQVQSDNSGYIDYLAVDPAHRSAGLGAALVRQACHELVEEGVSHIHLTVREDNAAARALYRSLGFVEERLAVPYRLGFELP